MTPQIIYEDDSLLVVNKPAGMVVNRSETTHGGETLQDWIEKNIRYFGKVPPLGKGGTLEKKNLEAGSEEFQSRSGIVHRLDKDTSGVLVAAKNQSTFSALQRQFKERLVKKTYIALVHGLFSFKTGEINAPLGRDPKNRQRFAVVSGGRPATTKYRVLQFLEGRGDLGRRGRLGSGGYTFLELEPLTGRTHQIRVHLAYLNHPVVADPWYAGRKTSRFDRSFCPRLFLHAQSLGFNHPRTGTWLKVEAELPEDLKQVIQALQTPPLTP